MLTREEALAFQARWRAVNAFQTGELRRMTPEDKLRQLDTLLRIADETGWRAALEEDDWRGHERWNELRKRFHG